MLDVSTVGPFSACPSCGNYNVQTDQEPSLAEVFVVFIRVMSFLTRKIKVYFEAVKHF